MKINFPKMAQNIPFECVPIEYKFYLETHRNFSKQQNDHNHFYLKYLGSFLLFACTYFIFGGKEISSNFLIATLVIGIGILYIMVMPAIFLDKNCDRELTHCIKTGKQLEEDFPNIIPIKLFHFFYASQTRARRVAFKSRFISIAIVLILTAAAGLTLAQKMVGLWLAISIGIFSATLLVAFFFFFNRIIEKNFK